MAKNELQYLSDSKVVEILFSDASVVKEAGLFEDIGFPSIANAIKDFAQGVADNDGSRGYVDTIINTLGSGILGRIHPLLGLFSAIASSAFGFNLSSIFGRFKRMLRQHFSSSGSLSLGEADQLARDAVGLQVSASLDPALDTLESYGFEVLARSKRRFRGSPKIDIPMIAEKGKPLLVKVFGNLGALRGKTLAAGILVWFLKTFLLGAGLVTAGVGAKMLYDKSKEVITETPSSKVEEEPHDHKQTETIVSRPSTTTPKYTVRQTGSTFKPSGAGTKYFPNSGGSLWVVPIIGRSINNTLIEWALDVYPESSKVEHLFEKSEDFQRTVSSLKRNYNYRDPDNLVMPGQFHSRKQVVDSFIEDVASLQGT
jgi:hypothetical protein